MKNFTSVLFLLIPASICFGQSGNKTSQYTLNALQSASKMLKAYHGGSARSGKVVKVVYFHAKDVQPFANWEARLQRTLADVSLYYKEQFNRYGISSEGVPFEKAGNKYVITVVQGDLPLEEYNIESGNKIRDEIQVKVGAKINQITDHVLVLTNICTRKEDTVFQFHSPYWGMGSSVNGWCFAADCEWLDPKGLTDTAHKMFMIDPATTPRNFTVAEFNSWYIGGIAHEMGHMFGLPHDFGNPAELAADERSLMGHWGSRHFRDYKWGGKEHSVISAAGIMQLISHPVFTQSVRSMKDTPQGSGDTLRFVNDEKGVTIRTQYSPVTMPYACYSLLRTIDLIEYFNTSALHVPGPGNELSLHLGKLPGALYVMSSVLMYPGGAIRSNTSLFFVNSAGVADVIKPPLVTDVDMQAFHDRLLKEEKTSINQQKIKVLQHILHGPAPVDLQRTTDKRVYLSDAQWTKAEVGWQEPARNYYTKESERTFFLENRGKLYEKGLFAHAPGVYTFFIGKQWKKFTALAAMRDDLIEGGTVKFTIWGDGKLLYSTPVLTTGQQAPVDIDISGVDVLELRTLTTGPTNGHCWSVWLDPVVER